METTVDELRALADAGATILNVGARGGRSEIRGAVRYRPHDLLTPEHLAIPIALDKPVVLYDENGDGDLTGQIAEKLRANGFAAWERAGGAIQESSIEQVVPPTHASEAQPLDRRI